MDNHRQHRGKYPDELRVRTVRMVLDHQNEYGSQWEAYCSVADKLGPKAETVRLWVRRAETDRGVRSGPTTGQLVEVKRLKRENGELGRANDILKAAAHFFGAGVRSATRRDVRVHRRAQGPDQLRSQVGYRADL